MKNNKGISLISVIIAILLVAILVVLIWIGIKLMNSVENGKTKDTDSKIAVNNDNDEENNLVSKKLEDLVYDAEFDYNTGINGFTYTTNEWGSTVETTHTYVKNSTEIEGKDLKTSSFPYINIDSVYAQEINYKVRELYEKYLQYFKDVIIEVRDTNAIEDLEERYYARQNFHTNQRVSNDIVNYEAYLNGNILSIVITEGPFTEVGFEYTVYNIDVVTGEKVSYQDIIEKSKYSDYSKLKNSVTKKAEEILLEVYSHDPELGRERLEENLEITLNDIFNNSGSLNAYGAYFNDENNLCLILSTFTGMGKDVQMYVYELE